MELIIKYLQVMLLIYILVGFVNLAITVSLGYWDKKMKAIDDLFNYIPMTFTGLVLAKAATRVAAVIFTVLFWGPQIFIKEE
jgi:hypothetical protein